MYSLSELSLIQNDEVEAKSRAQDLVNQFPNTIYADRVIDKFDLIRPEIADTLQINPKTRFTNILNNSSISSIEKAERFIDFEERNRKTKLGENALFEAVNFYIISAKMDSIYESKIREWRALNDNWSDIKDEFYAKQESAIETLEDSVLSPSDSLFYIQLIDSSLTEPDLISAFPYRGEYWDSTRITIDKFLRLYPNSQKKSNISILKIEFEVPIEPVIEEEEENDETDDLVVSESDSYLSCENIEQEVLIRGGKEAFVNRIELPSERTETDITFLFYINIRGIIDEFKLSSDNKDQAIVDAFITTIDGGISFDPILIEGKTTAVSCNITFNF